MQNCTKGRMRRQISWRRSLSSLNAIQTWNELDIEILTFRQQSLYASLAWEHKKRENIYKLPVAVSLLQLKSSDRHTDQEETRPGRQQLCSWCEGAGLNPGWEGTQTSRQRDNPRSPPAATMPQNSGHWREGGPRGSQWGFPGIIYLIYFCVC